MVATADAGLPHQDLPATQRSPTQVFPPRDSEEPQQRVRQRRSPTDSMTKAPSQRAERTLADRNFVDGTDFPMAENQPCRRSRQSSRCWCEQTNDLVNTLPTEAELVTNALKRNALRAKCHDLRVTNNVCRRSRAEWSPFPSRDCVECFHSFGGEESRSLALADVSDPCSEVDGSPVFLYLGVRCRDSCVSGACEVGVEGCEVLVPSFGVCHVGNHTSS